MAEVLGAVGSTLTICQAVAEVVSHVMELYRAPAEVKALQEQLQGFRDVIQALEATSNLFPHNVLRSALSSAQNTLEKLHNVINVKLIRQGDGSARARRRAWLRNKRHIKRLQDNLKEERETLLGVVSADILSSTRQTLQIISQQSTGSQSMALGIDQRLENIENVLEYQQLVHATKLNEPIISSPLGVLHESGDAASCWLNPSMRRFAHFSEKSTLHATDTVVISKKSAYTSCATYMQTPSPQNRPAHQVFPAGPFELLASFRPETYTILDAVPTLFGYRNVELDATEYSRINQCAMFFSKAPRKWVRLTASITTTIDSKYWSLGRVKSIDHISKTFNPLPTGLILEVEAFLRSFQNVQQDSHLSVFLGNSSDLVENGTAHKVPIKFIKPPFQVKTYLKEITNMVHHLNCLKYTEGELIQRPLYQHHPRNVFMAFLQSRWVLEYRFGSDKEQIDALLYMLEVLHCLQNAPLINPLIGVVLDDETGIINSFLCEMPAKGNLFHVLKNEVKSGPPVTWDRRGKWCRQIVQAVAELHSKGFVVGSLGEGPDCVFAIDANDDAVLYKKFRRSFIYNSWKVGILPPECRHLASTAGVSIDAIPQTDIYQLGLQLWQIAANQNCSLRPSFCKLGGCTNTTTTKNNVCAEPHADPIQLPSPNNDMPQYLREVIAACRAESPDKRPPAWELLKMFPPITMAKDEAKLMEPGPINSGGTDIASFWAHRDILEDASKIQPSTRRPSPGKLIRYSSSIPNNYLTRLEDCFERHPASAYCDLCGERTTNRYFHCSICAASDFDICPRCFSQGCHCLDRRHYLCEILAGGAINTNQRRNYYTSADEKGRRDIIAP